MTYKPTAKQLAGLAASRDKLIAFNHSRAVLTPEQIAAVAYVRTVFGYSWRRIAAAAEQLGVTVSYQAWQHRANYLCETPPKMGTWGAKLLDKLAASL